MAVETLAPMAEKVVVAEAEKETAVVAEDDEKKSNVAPSPSFKEESNLVTDLSESEKKALDELKELVQSAIDNNEFNTDHDAPAEEKQTKVEKSSSPSPAAADSEKAWPEDDGAKTVESIQEALTRPTTEHVSIWGVPLLSDERSDTVLLKFLRAREFKPREAMVMVKNTVKWREEFGVEALLEEDLGVSELEKVVFMHGVDREGHPVCYNVYGELQENEILGRVLGDDEKCRRFLRWRTRFLEKGIRELLVFKPGGVSTMVQVTDLKNSPGLAKRELRQATNQALALLQDNYPEFVAKQIFINVPWWYLAFNRMISPFLTQRTKSKFIFAGPSKTTETLIKYIAPEQLPIQYGGLSDEKHSEFCSADAVTEINVKPSTKEIVEIPVSEECVLAWELRVVGWDVIYGVEFVPSSENGYTVIIQKARKFAQTDEAVSRNNFKVAEPGKVVLTVDNTSSRRKKILFRSKTKG